MHLYEEEKESRYKNKNSFMNLSISWTFGFPIPWAKQVKDCDSTDIESGEDGSVRKAAEGFALTQQSLARRLFSHSPRYARHLSVLNAGPSSGDSEEDDDDDIREREGRERVLGNCDLFVEISEPVERVELNVGNTPSVNNNKYYPVTRGICGVVSTDKQQAEHSGRVSPTEEIGHTSLCPKNDQDDKEEANDGNEGEKNIRGRSLRGIETVSKSQDTPITHGDSSKESLTVVNEQQNPLTCHTPSDDNKEKALEDQSNSQMGSEEWIEQRQGVAKVLNSHIGESLVSHTAENPDNGKYSLSGEESAYLGPFEPESIADTPRKRHELRYWLKLSNRHSSESLMANPIAECDKYPYPQTCVDIYHEETANSEICKTSKRSRIKRRFSRVSSARLRKLSKSA